MNHYLYFFIVIVYGVLSVQATEVLEEKRHQKLAKEKISPKLFQVYEEGKKKLTKTVSNAAYKTLQENIPYALPPEYVTEYVVNPQLSYIYEKAIPQAVEIAGQEFQKQIPGLINAVGTHLKPYAYRAAGAAAVGLGAYTLYNYLSNRGLLGPIKKLKSDIQQHTVIADALDEKAIGLEKAIDNNTLGESDKNNIKQINKLLERQAADPLAASRKTYRALEKAIQNKAQNAAAPRTTQPSVPSVASDQGRSAKESGKRTPKKKATTMTEEAINYVRESGETAAGA
jgi:hypothetical protein